MRQLMCCCFSPDGDGERGFMFLRAHLSAIDAMHHSAKLGLPIAKQGGGFSCVNVPDDLVDKLYEYADEPLSEAKAQELVGDAWDRMWSP